MSHKGKIKWYNSKKGYGFIEVEEPKDHKDVFLHASAVREAGLKFVNEGTPISFELSDDSGKGPAAINIKVES